MRSWVRMGTMAQEERIWPRFDKWGVCVILASLNATNSTPVVLSGREMILCVRGSRPLIRTRVPWSVNVRVRAMKLLSLGAIAPMFVVLMERRLKLKLFIRLYHNNKAFRRSTSGWEKVEPWSIPTLVGCIYQFKKAKFLELWAMKAYTSVIDMPLL